MPTRQAAAVVRSAAAAVGNDVDPTRWAADLRRDSETPSSLGALVAQVEGLGHRADLTFLRRTPEELDGLADASALPIIVLAEADGARGARVAFVLLTRDGGVLRGVAVAADGRETPLDVPAEGTRAALTTRAGGGDVALVCLVPVSVAPTVTPSAAAADGGAPAAPTPLRRLWHLVLRERRDVALVWGYAALAGLFSLTLPLGVQQIVTMVSGRLLLQPTYILIAFVVLGTLGVGVLQVMQLSVVETIQQRVFARMALEFGYRVPRLPYETVVREDLPETMNRFFETITIQKSLAKLLVDFSTALLTIFFGLVLLTLYHPYFTFFSGALVLGLALIFRWTAPKGLETSLMESKYKYRAVHWLEEMARAFTAFKYAGRSALPIERMDELVTGYLKYRKKHFRVLVQQTVSVIGFKTLITGALLIVGIVLVQDNQITLGQFVASEIVIVTVLAGIEKLILGLATVYDILTAVDKAGYVTDLPLEAPGGLAPATDAAGMGVEFRGLTYRYPGSDHPALRGVTLSIAPGERVGVTGYDGSGQTTLLKLAGGLLDAFEGAATFDGVPLRDLDRAALRDTIGQMLSPTDLFDGTVEENVAVGRRQVTTRDALRALDAVGLGAWLESLPQGLRTPVTNGGRGLSASVANKLLVARGIAGRPRLIVVDDFFQNVEPDYRHELIRSLTDRANAWTMLLVSHDPAFLAACDRVVVLEAGRVSRVGTFAGLARDTTFVQSLLHTADVRP